MTKQKNLAHWLKRFAVLFIATLVAGLIAEGAVLLFAGEQVKFPRHVVESGFGLRINEPHAQYRHKSPDLSVSFRINGQGMRSDVEYTYEKPAGTLRILSLGDSFTAGYEVEVEECFSNVLERELRAKGYQVEVLNAGVSGYSTAEECLYLERELLKYDPDVVLVSYYTNDPRDNFRTELFELGEGDVLVLRKESYIPGGELANFLNTNFIFSFLSEYSNAFALLKDTITQRTKQQMVTNSQVVIPKDAPERAPVVRKDGTLGKVRKTSPGQRLTGALYDRIFDNLHQRGIPLVIQSIPHLGLDKETGHPYLADTFPRRAFPVKREGVSYLRMKPLLEARFEDDQLYYRRSNKHWTPFAHRLSGEALAKLIDEDGLLKP